MEEIKIGIVPNKEELKKRLDTFDKDSDKAVVSVGKRGGFDPLVQAIAVGAALFAKLLNIKDFLDNILDLIKKIIKAIKEAAAAAAAAIRAMRNAIANGSIDRSKGSFGASVDVGGG